jgi:transposase
MKANLLLVGIDVGRRELVVAIRNGGQIHVLRFANDLAGRRYFVAVMRQRAACGAIIRVALEATGPYSFELALLLSQSERFEVSVINPKTIKHFLRAQGARGKTDKIDARGILQYLELMPFRSWSAPAPVLLALQAIARRLYQLNAERTREANRLAAIEVLGSAGKAVAAELRQAIRQIDRRVEKLEAAALELFQSDPMLQRKYELVTSITGIAQKSAIRLLGELLVLDPAMKGAQWVAYAGLDPRPRQSGTSIDGHRYISKAGNRYVRAALYMPALVAIRHEQVFTTRYRHLVDERGKPKLIAIVATMRKLLLCLHSMLKNDAPFDPTKLAPKRSLEDQAVIITA